MTSKPYQDLIAKLRKLKSEKEQIVEHLKNQRKTQKSEINSLYKNKTKVKFEIW